LPGLFGWALQLGIATGLFSRASGDVFSAGNDEKSHLPPQLIQRHDKNPLNQPPSPLILARIK
jgi:hypothetical protein